MTTWSPGGPGDEVNELRDQLSAATNAAQQAYRDSSRLIRLLAVIGEPASPQALIDRALGALSEVFSAELTCLVHSDGEQTEIVAACGFSEDDSWQLPVLPDAQDLFTRNRLAAWVCAIDEAPRVAGVPVRSAACIPSSDGPSVGGALVLLRSDPAPFSPGELQMLQSVAARLKVSVEAGERRQAIERLARAGHRFTRHLELAPLLDEAVEVLHEMAAAECAIAVTVQDELVVLRAHTGIAADWAASWPRPVAELMAWPSALRGEPFVCADVLEPLRAPEPLEPLEPLAERELAGVRALLCVPVLEDGRPVALLYVGHSRPGFFSRATVDAAAVLAGYVGAALVNARLYGALADGEARLRLLTDAISDMIAVVDAQGIVRYASPSYLRGVGRDPVEITGADLSELVHPDDRESFRSSLRACPAASSVEYRLLDGHGQWVWVESRLGPEPDDTGSVVISSRLVGDRRRLEDELRQAATHDSLTGLANADLARQLLDASLSSHRDDLVGLLFCDLDKFKAVNDRLGHEAGDDLLCQVADRLRSCVRPHDLLARLGGDEFLIVLPSIADLDTLTVIGNRVLEALEEPFLLGAQPVRIAASVGGVVGERGPNGSQAVELLRDADAAMYEAKKRGRGRVEVFDRFTAQRAVDRLTLREDLLTALDRGELELHYQSIVELDDATVTGFEALLRWNHPELGRVSPDIFIPMAEESGAINSIGWWVLVEACRQLAVWRREFGPHLSMSVNVSPVQLSDPAFAMKSAEIIREAGVRTEDVWFEVTESFEVTEELVAQLHLLRDVGVRVAMDDFGMSYSNLAYLKHLPVECLKIDRSFIAGLSRDDTGNHGLDRGIVRAILAIAESGGLSVVAEGIETEEQRTMLMELGCRQGQGYLFGPPGPAGDATDLLAPLALTGMSFPGDHGSDTYLQRGHRPAAGSLALRR